MCKSFRFSVGPTSRKSVHDSHGNHPAEVPWTDCVRKIGDQPDSESSSKFVPSLWYLLGVGVFLPHGKNVSGPVEFTIQVRNSVRQTLTAAENVCFRRQISAAPSLKNVHRQQNWRQVLHVLLFYVPHGWSCWDCDNLDTTSRARNHLSVSQLRRRRNCLGWWRKRDSDHRRSRTVSLPEPGWTRQSQVICLFRPDSSHIFLMSRDKTTTCTTQSELVHPTYTGYVVQLMLRITWWSWMTWSNPDRKDHYTFFFDHPP